MEILNFQNSDKMNQCSKDSKEIPTKYGKGMQRLCMKISRSITETKQQTEFFNKTK